MLQPSLCDDEEYSQAPKINLQKYTTAIQELDSGSLIEFPKRKA
jgi:hypothetical protein